MEKTNKDQELEYIGNMHGTFKTNYLTKKYKERKKWSPPDPKNILSYIPGTVSSINVKVGDTVNKDDILMLFNAMKMNNQIKSPISGVVKNILVNIGDTVPKGTVMIELE